MTRIVRPGHHCKHRTQSCIQSLPIKYHKASRALYRTTNSENPVKSHAFNPSYTSQTARSDRIWQSGQEPFFALDLQLQVPIDDLGLRGRQGRRICSDRWPGLRGVSVMIECGACSQRDGWKGEWLQKGRGRYWLEWSFVNTGRSVTVIYTLTAFPHNGRPPLSASPRSVLRFACNGNPPLSFQNSPDSGQSNDMQWEDLYLPATYWVWLCSLQCEG